MDNQGNTPSAADSKPATLEPTSPTKELPKPKKDTSDAERLEMIVNTPFFPFKFSFLKKLL